MRQGYASRGSIDPGNRRVTAKYFGGGPKGDCDGVVANLAAICPKRVAKLVTPVELIDGAFHGGE